MKKLLLIVTMFVLLATLVSAEELNPYEYQMNAILSTMGLDESVVVVNGNDEIIVDYVLNNIESEFDLTLQLQTIFIAAARIHPNSTLTVVKARYTADTSPLLVAAVPTSMTLLYLEDMLTPEQYMYFVTFNDPDLVDELDDMEEQGMGFWSWFFIILLILALLYFVFKKKDKISKFVKDKLPEKEDSEVKETKKSSEKVGLIKFSNPQSGILRKFIAFILNLIFPGLGYFLFGKRYIVKAILFLVVFLIIGRISFFAMIFKLYILIDFVYSLINHGEKK